MACIALDGALTVSGRKVLAAFQAGRTPEDVAAATDLPLFQIRSSLRELVASGLIESSAGGYRITANGRERLDRAP